MTDTRLITRLMQAAEQWTRGRYGRDMVVVAHGDAERFADGRVQTVIELDTRTAGKHQRVRCITTLEPDGSVSCIGESEISATSAPK